MEGLWPPFRVNIKLLLVIYKYNVNLHPIMPKILEKTIPYFRVGSAVCCYFCIWDLKRASDPVYKKNLYEKRKEAYSQSLCRPITEKLLKPLVEKYGSLDILKHPMQGMVHIIFRRFYKSG